MITALLTTALSLPNLFSVGVEFECRSWPGLARTKLDITLLTGSGHRNDGTDAEIEKIADAGAVQDTIFLLLEREGWDVRRGPKDTVIVFAPKGQWVKSVAIKSDGWAPGYKYVLGNPKAVKKP